MLGLVGAAVLAGGAVDWLILRRHVRPRVAAAALVVVAALAIMEAGWTGAPAVRGLMPTADALRALDRPIAADHSGSIVLDVPFGLRGRLPLYRAAVAEPAILLATEDSHPRAVSYTPWVTRAQSRELTRHPC